MSVITYYKHYTETLAVMVERFRLENPSYTQSPITYAGRLDPLAEGLMILLTDEDVHKKEDYLHLLKTYEVEILFGIATDTYDILGIPTSHGEGEPPQETITETLTTFLGTHTFPYPAYSSKTINGVPLYQLAKKGELDEITIPTRAMTITTAEYLGNHILKNFPAFHTQTIKSIKGDFRQADILSAWQPLLSNREEVVVHTMKFEVTSGTYIRTLVHELGKQLNTGACSIRIKRTHVGNMTIY